MGCKESDMTEQLSMQGVQSDGLIGKYIME